jgi:hypothetical protein
MQIFIEFVLYYAMTRARKGCVIYKEGRREGG